MNSISQKLQRLVIASAFASGLVSVGVAASAQVTAAPAATTVKATSVSLSTVNAKAKRQAALERDNAETRRIAFRHLGTSI